VLQKGTGRNNSEERGEINGDSSQCEKREVLGGTEGDMADLIRLLFEIFTLLADFSFEPLVDATIEVTSI
jgi:hypothetical protein